MDSSATCCRRSTSVNLGGLGPVSTPGAVDVESSSPIRLTRRARRRAGEERPKPAWWVRRDRLEVMILVFCASFAGAYTGLRIQVVPTASTPRRQGERRCLGAGARLVPGEQSLALGALDQPFGRSFANAKHPREVAHGVDAVPDDGVEERPLSHGSAVASAEGSAWSS